MKHLAGFALIFAFPCAMGAAEPVGALHDRVLSAIRIGANYTCDVLLDEEGKSRCDYDMITGRWQPYEPAWHTGQLILGLVESYRVTHEPRFLAGARRAGNWWVSLEIRDHPRLKGMVRAVHGAGVNYIVFATVSDGTPGLFALWRETGDERYAAVPTRAGEWMLQHMYDRENGVFYDAVDPETGEVQKVESPFWEGRTEQKLYDLARPNNEGSIFKDMYLFTHDERYRQVFIELCDSLVAKQGPEGMWMDFTPNNKAEGRLHPRFNLWYAESLLEGYDLTGDRRYLESAVRTLQAYTRLQKKDGTIFYTNYLDGRSTPNSPSGSTVALAGLLWLRVTRLGAGTDFEANIERSLEWILANRFAADHPDRNVAGGFIDLRSSGQKNRLVQRDLGTSFALRFLAAYYRDRLANATGDATSPSPTPPSHP
ncbi:MAG: hypothetical protein IAE82_17080 [Opitutaceae bacterium]|nr:hypothetical protein [Opitutaceae bacterium]